MASATITRPAPGPDPAAGRRSRRWSWPVLALAGARAGHAGRVPRLPDVSQLRLLLLAAVGPRAAARRQPTFDGYRAPTEHPLADRLRRAALARSATGADRVMVGATLASFVVLAAGLYRLGAGVVHAARRPRRRRAAAARASTSRSSPRARYIDIPYLALRRLGGGARGRAPAARHAGVRAARLRRAAAPGGVAAQRPVLPVVRPAARPWPQRVTLRRRSPRVGAGDLDRDRLVVDRRPAVLADPHERPGRGARAHAAGLSRGARPRRWSSSRASTRCRSSTPAIARRRRSRSARAAARRACRWRCWSSAWARSCSSASPGCRSSTATCSCPSLMVMVFAAVALGGWTMLRAGPRCARRGRSGPWRSSSTAWSSRPRA